MAAAAGPDIVEDGLVLCLDAANERSYPGSGTTWFDLSGNENAATLDNSPTLDSKGNFVFDGSNQRARVDHSNELNMNSSFTVTAWIKESNNAFSSSYWNGVSKYSQFILGPSGDDRMAFLVHAGGWYPSGYGSPSTWPNQSTINYENFHQYVGTYDIDNGLLALWIDGIKTVEHSASTSLSSDTGLIQIAKRDSSGNYLSGSVNGISIYNKLLSPLEIKQNFQATRGRYGI